MGQKKRVKSVYEMRSPSVILKKYAQLGGSLEEDIEKKKKEISDLESQLSAEKNAEKRKRIERSLADAKNKVTEIQNRMKEMLKNVAERAGKVASKLSSGISSAASKLSSGISSAASKLSSGISSATSSLSKLFEKNKNERAIRDYYSMKSKVVMQIEMLKRQKPKKDEICKRVSEKTCNEIVSKKYPIPGDLFVNEEVGGIQILYYY
jgi:chromosome segregation ATPase